ncbi:MAG: aconitase X swivel domain-containing protein [Gammaproteobacteria bacterium]
MTRTLQGNVLIAGSAEGPALVLEETLSFWGGFDPQAGKIIDTHHPQFGQTVADRVLFIPASRGSAGTPGGIAESLRNGSGPCAFVLGKRDVNISVGTLVANRLYDLQVPVIEIPLADMKWFSSGDRVRIDQQGRLSIILTRR